jgi:mRNA-degrading endonuclease RelE of RelBE toxin-antitoxin system
MKCNVVFTPLFEKEFKHLCKKYPSFKSDFGSLYEKLQENPRLGEEVIKDCYKIRLAITSKNKGKSGGARVITFFYTTKDKLLLLGVYDKSEKKTFTEREIKVRLKEIED